MSWQELVLIDLREVKSVPHQKQLPDRTTEHSKVGGGKKHVGFPPLQPTPQGDLIPPESLPPRRLADRGCNEPHIPGQPLLPLRRLRWRENVELVTTFGRRQTAKNVREVRDRPAHFGRDGIDDDLQGDSRKIRRIQCLRT